MNVPRPAPEQMLIHFYRAVVGHADVWRKRMDATTNWAAAATAAMITFAFSVEAMHIILLLALAFDCVFLLMESRRYRVYHLWRQRFLLLNQYVVAPTIAPEEGPPPEVISEKLEELAADLGRTTPRLHLLEAVGYRIHKNYGFIFGIVVLAWILKLSIHPESATGWREVVERAHIGGLPGGAVMGMVGAFLVAALGLALWAPNERIIDWVESPPRLRRWVRRRR
jgi:uncharacterized membrane protein